MRMPGAATSETSSSARTRALAVVLFAITAAVFATACLNQFVNYDDPDYVTANDHVRAGLSLATVRWALTAQAASNWHPLTWLSHALDVSLFGMSPAGHHAMSVMLHSLNAALAFLALRCLTQRTAASFVVAAVFALHPLRVESVAWVAERKDVLSGGFFFLTLWAYARYVVARGERSGEIIRTSNGPRVGGLKPALLGPASAYGLALLFFALGLLAKPMLVTVPCVLLLLDYWPLQRIRRDAGQRLRTLIVEKLPFFALAVGSSAATYFAQAHGGAVSFNLEFRARLANAIVAFARYLGKMFWPTNLSVLYPHPGHWSGAVVAGALAFILAVTFAACRMRRSRPWIIVGWLWFIGMLVPVSGVIQVGMQSMADRYTYLPALGVEVAFVWTLAGFAPRRLAVTTTLSIIALATLTIRQLGTWRDSLTLFTQAIAVTGEGNFLAYDNRGIAWSDRGDLDRALADYRRSLAINPTYANANNNYGLALAKLGRVDDAIAHYKIAVREMPENLEVHNNLANALSDVGRFDEALAEFKYILERSPRHLNALNGEAVIWAQRGDLAAAERQFRRVLELDPANLGAMTNLGNVYAIRGQREEAVHWLSQALAGKPDDPVVLFNLGELNRQLGKYEEAADKFAAAVRLRPLNPDAHYGLGYSLARLGRTADALGETQVALQQRPNFPAAAGLAEALKKAK